jgi:hypothetical protein
MGYHFGDFHEKKMPGIALKEYCKKARFLDARYRKVSGRTKTQPLLDQMNKPICRKSAEKVLLETYSLKNPELKIWLGNL